MANNINLATKYIGCVFDKYFRASNTNGLLNKKLVFDRCTINANSSCSIDYVLTDIDILNCEINSTVSSQLPSAMIDFGREVVTSGKSVRIDNLSNNANLFTYLLVFRNTSLNAFVNNTISTGRIFTSGSINRLELTNVLYVFPNGYYSPIATDTNATNMLKFNTKTASGISYDNYE